MIGMYGKLYFTESKSGVWKKPGKEIQELVVTISKCCSFTILKLDYSYH